MTKNCNADLRRARILVVEDEGLIARDIQLSLEELGHTVVGVAGTATEATQLFETTSFDLVLMDIHLSGSTDGVELARQVWKRLRCPVIYLTAHSDYRTLERAKLAASFGYIVKPFSPESLKVSIEIALQRHEVEREAERRRGWLDEILSSIGDGVIVTDAHSEIVFLNRAAEDLLGLTADFALGKPLAAAATFHIDQGVCTALQSSEPEASVQFSTAMLTRHDHQERVVLLSQSFVGDEAGSPGGQVISFRDISEIRKTESTLRETNDFLIRSNERLNQLSHSLSHDLQEPLRNIRTASEFLTLRHGADLDDSGQEYLGFITEGCSRMGSLMTSLLEYYRAPSYKVSEDTLVEASGALDEALYNLRTAIDESGAHIEFSSLPKVHFHPVALVQVFQNLIGNAIKYRGAAAPSIQIEAGYHDFRWTFEIRDNGLGFDARQTERIFDLFSRAHGHDVSGSGVGLATCRRLVEQYGGSIWAESQPGMGSIFRFFLQGESVLAAA